MSGLWQDLRLTARGLARAPWFTAMAVATLALGIGANTAIFSVVHAVLLRPLPYGEPERLVLVWNRIEKSAIVRAPVSSPDLVDFREQATLFEGFAATNNVNEMTLTGGVAPEQIKVALVTDNFFDVLNVRPGRGRSFTPEDGVPFPPGTFDLPEAEIPGTAVVLGHGFWQRRFGGEPAVLGKRLWAGGQPLEIVGVLSPEFHLLMPPDAGMPTDVDAWMVMRMDHADRPREQGWLRVVARLRDGVSLAQARAEMAEIGERQREVHAFHRNMGVSVDVRPLAADVVAHVRPVLLALAGAVGFVLAIACANVASLMLARAASRRREMSLRVAMGASGSRLVRQALTEGLLLAALGAVLGVVLARWGVEGLLALGPPDVPRLTEVSLGGPVLLFTLLVAALSAFLFSLVPAMMAAGTEATGTLGERGASSSGGGHMAQHGILVVVEVALALVLLVGAGLMARSFLNLARVNPGFQPQGVVSFKLSLPFREEYGTPRQRAAFFHQAEKRFTGLPGAEAVGSIFPAPLGGRFWTGPYGFEHETPDQWKEREANFRSVTPGYFNAVGARMVAGRAIEQDDVDNARRVAVVDLPFISRMWPESGPYEVLGRRFGLDVFGNQGSLEIVGVVEHVRHAQLTQDGSETVYFPFHLWPWSQMTVMLRARGDVASLAAAAQGIVTELEPDVPIYAVRTLGVAVREAMAPQRFTLVLITVFAGVAMLLAAVGIYGVLSYAVRRRTSEIGVRMAMGAGQGAILRQVVARSFTLSGFGVVLGLMGAAVLSRTFSSLLYGVDPTDPVTFAALAAGLLAVALTASLVPAWRASRVDPMVCLRTN